jgi:2-succinyl-6-hydroxy-2,4-cyclohexadiene-1-carboxylate synthase
MNATIISNGFRYRIHYQVYHGHLLQEQSLPVLVFWHGFLGDAQDFSGVIQHLPEAMPCITVDLPGHGKTEVDRVNSDAEDGITEYESLSKSLDKSLDKSMALGYTMPNVAKALRQFLIHLATDLGVSQIILVGYSLGGRLALYFVHRFPDYIKKYVKYLVLESASPGLKSQEQQRVRQQKDLALVQQLMGLNQSDFPDFLDHWYSQDLFKTLRAHPEFANLKAQRTAQNPQRLALSLRGLGVGWQRSLWQELNQIQLPTWLVVGDSDAKFREINQEMAELLPNAHLVYLENCGHNGHYEQPQQFAKSLGFHGFSL